jgi:hypothetical protein
MPFVGNQPTAIPLSADDLEDNIISTAKIQDNAVTAAKYIEPIPFRNIIINGDMSIAQRGTSFTSQTASNFIVDRFTQNINGTMGTWTNGQETDAPANTGFQKSLFMNCTTADAAPSASDFVRVEQRFEGQNLQYLKKGTASAVSLTASFWVKSPKTGTHIAELEDRDNTRYVSQLYTINTANTWEFKTVTFPPDTSGTLNNDNGESLRLNFWLGAGTDWTSGTLGTTWHTTAANRASGQVNVADAIHSTDNYWQITGVQLEAGTTASDFEFLPVDVNLQRCQRYYYALLNTGENNNYFISGYYYCHTEFPTTMRASPSLVQSRTDYYNSNSVGDGFDSFNQNITFLTRNATFGNNSQVSGTGGNAGRVYSTNTNSYVHFNAEL